MTNKLKFCIVVNINTSGNKKLLNEVISLLRNNHDVEVFESKSENIAREIFKDLSSKIFDRLVLAGGDGSVNFAINEILQHPSLLNKEIGYIPIGTANILQIEANIKKKAEAIKEVLVSEKIKKVNLAKINGRFFFLMVGIGFDGKIVASIDTNIKKYLGKVIFALKGFQQFLFLNNEKMEVLIDDERMEADWILSTNSKYYAGPYKITKTTDIFQNGLVTYIFKNLTRLKLLYYVCLILFKGDLSAAKSIVATQAKNIKINKLNSNLVAQVDGEFFESNGRIEIEETNKFINLLVS